MPLSISNITHQAALDYIEPFLQKGFSQLTTEESSELHRVSLLIQEYEKVRYPLPF